MQSLYPIKDTDIDVDDDMIFLKKRRRNNQQKKNCTVINVMKMI